MNYLSCLRTDAPTIPALDATTIASALNRARPCNLAGTFNPSQSQNVKGQSVAWRYSVSKIADALQSRYGAAFDRRAFLAECGYPL